MFIKENILITGAAQRIGASIAKFLASKGHKVIIHCNQSITSGQKIIQEINESSKKNLACLVNINLENPKHVESLFSKIPKDFLPVTCLINNASIFEFDDINSINFDTWNRHMLINLWAPITLCKQMAKAIPQKLKGNIINIIDQRVLNLTPYFLSYTLSKSSLLTLTKQLALEMAPKIRVNAIGPGPIIKNVMQTDQDFARQCKQVPLKHGPSLDEINQTIAFILANNSLTGQIIAIDGGQHMGWCFPNQKIKKFD